MDQTVPLTGLQRPWQLPAPRRRRMGTVLLISLWLHLTVLLLLVVTIEQRGSEGLPPPSTVDLVFESGDQDKPPTEQQLAVPSAPPPAPSASQAQAVPVPPVPPPAPAVELPPPTPPPPVAVAPQPAPLPTPPTPPAEAGELPLPPPLPPVAMLPRLTPPPAPTPQRPSPPQRAAPPQAVAPQRPAPAPAPGAFPTPMAFSFGGSKALTPPSASAPKGGQHGRRTLDISLTLQHGDTGTTLNGRGGEDWGNELVAWVNQHKYYPPQAAMNGEDGEVMVRVVVNPNGKVTSVEKRRGSGSQWLDMALVALFRDANVPPPPDKSEPTEFNFTMHYILIRR